MISRDPQPAPIRLNITPMALERAQLRPVVMDEGFRDPAIMCFHHDLGVVSGSSDDLSALPSYGAMFHTAGEVRQAEPEQLCPGGALTIARLAASQKTIQVFRETARRMDSDVATLFRVFYYRSCTIVSMAAIEHNIMTDENFDQEDDHSIHSPQGILARTFIPAPLSSHNTLAAHSRLMEDLRKHVRMLNGTVAALVLGDVRYSV